MRKNSWQVCEALKNKSNEYKDDQLNFFSKISLSLALGCSLALHSGPALIKAVINGDLAAAKDKLAAGENINEGGKNGWTPLMWAVWYRQPDITSFLLEKGADPNIPSTDSYRSYPKGATALIIASIDCLDDHAALLVKAKAKIDLVDSTGNSAQTYGRKNNCPSVLRAMGLKAAENSTLDLLLEGIAAGNNVNAPDKNGWTPLMWSVYYGDLPTTQLLLEKGADPNLKTSGGYRAYPVGVTALIIAGIGAMDEQAGVLLKGKAMVNISDSKGKTAIDYARESNCTRMLSLMGIPANQDLESALKKIRAGKDVNALDSSGWSQLMWAAYYRDDFSTETLLGLGADPNIQSTNTCQPAPKQTFPKGVTALILASKLDSEKTVALLVAHKANPKIVDASGNTAESYAIAEGYYGVQDALMDRSHLPKIYRKILVGEFIGQKNITSDYPYAPRQCQTSTKNYLLETKSFESVEMAVDGQAYDDATLLVKMEILEMRVPSGAARFFLGPAAGSTYMNFVVRLIDPATGRVEREQLFSSANSVWLSSFTLSALDENFIKNTGLIIANYVLSVGGSASPKASAPPESNPGAH